MGLKSRVRRGRPVRAPHPRACTARRRGRRRRAARRRRSPAPWRARRGRTAGRRTRSRGPGAGTVAVAQPRRVDPPIRTTPLLGRSSVPMTCRSVDLPDPEGPTIATSSPRRTEKDIPGGGHRRLLAVDLGHPVELQDSSPLIATAPPRSLRRASPSTGPVRRRCRTGPAARRPAAPPPSRTTSTATAAGLPTIAVTGTLRACPPLGRDLGLDRGLVEPARRSGRRG